LVDNAEVPNLLDLVPPELDAEGMLLSRWEDVENATPHCEITAVLDEFSTCVASGDQASDKFGQLAAGVTGSKRYRLQIAQAGDLGLQHRPDRSHNDCDRARCRLVRRRVPEPAKDSHPLPDGVGARREAFVRERLPTRIEDDLVRWKQAPQPGDEVVRLASVARHGKDGSAGTGSRGDDEGLKGPGAGDCQRSGIVRGVHLGQGRIGLGSRQQRGERCGEGGDAKLRHG
jgi:hypothetical protein